MSLFDDDFYGKQGSNSAGKSIRSSFGVLLLAAGIGLLLTFLVFPYLVNRGYVQVDLSQSRSEKISAVAEQLQPAIVSIFAYTAEDEALGDGAGDGGDVMPGEENDYSIGSGVVIKRDGEKALIVTNNHVIELADDIEVMLYTGERMKARLVGKDKLSDLAVVEVKSKLISQLAEFGDSDRLRIGETAIAIGNPLGLGNTPSITTGVISSVKRTVPVYFDEDEQADWELDVVQTDAAINEGNSGGALLNLRGELVGIISMKMYDIGVEGLAFALPINQALPIIEQLIMEKKVKRPYIGIRVQDLSEYGEQDSLKLPKEVKKGAVVLDVEGPAKTADLRVNDVIVRLDNQMVEDAIDVRKYLYAKKQIGDSMRIVFYRGTEKMTLRLQLAELKEE